MSFNHKNYNFYIKNYNFYIIIRNGRKLPFFDPEKGDYVVTRHKKSKKWGFLHLQNSKYIPVLKEQHISSLDGRDLFDSFVKTGGWVEVQVKKVGYQIV